MIKPAEKNADGKKYINTSGLELVIVNLNNRILSIVFEDKKMIDLEVDNYGCLPMDTVCIGRVAEVSNNIDAAFVLLPDKSKGYLRLNGQQIKCETSIPVRITRLASKGKLCSVQITDDDISHFSDFTVLKYGLYGYYKLLNQYKFDRIITDLSEIYNELNEKEAGFEVNLYEDKLVNLSTLYSVSKYLKEATDRIVWLKSGANICIEPTAAFTVVDVNSAKYVSKDNCYLDVNLEAANEIFRQMNIRNISGIILIDFINMKSEEDNSKLVEFLREKVKSQKIYTRYVDITPLGIAEITRKKIGLTIYDFYFEK